jgi:hypothetical protein
MLGGVEVTAKAREHARDMLAVSAPAREKKAAAEDTGATVRVKRPPALKGG